MQSPPTSQGRKPKLLDEVRIELRSRHIYAKHIFKCPDFIMKYNLLEYIYAAAPICTFLKVITRAV